MVRGGTPRRGSVGLGVSRKDCDWSDGVNGVLSRKVHLRWSEQGGGGT